MQARGFPWRFVELPGDHPLDRDELATMAEWSAGVRRDAYPRAVAVQRSSLSFASDQEDRRWETRHARDPERPIRLGSMHWVELLPVADADGKPAPQKVLARNLGGNRISVIAQEAKRIRLYLHPSMVDLAKPVTVLVNEAPAFEGEVRPRMETLLERVRRTGDRGAVYHAAIEVDVATSRAVTLEMLPPRDESGEEKR